MFLRLTYFGFKPEKLKELKKFYNEVAIPTLKKQKGNLECKLLEPVDKKEDYISMTTWEKKEDADAYHNSGVYKNLVDQVRPFFSKEPVLRVYESKDVMEHA
jgi:quinol monooxygenase YgiN